MCKNSFYNTILSLYQHETKQLIKWTLWKVIPFKKFSSILILNTHSLSVYVLRYKNRNPLFIVGSYYDLKAFPTIKSPISEKLRNNSAHWYKILHKTIVKDVKRYAEKNRIWDWGQWKSVRTLLFACCKDYLKTHILCHDLTA